MNSCAVCGVLMCRVGSLAHSSEVAFPYTGHGNKCSIVNTIPIVTAPAYCSLIRYEYTHPRYHRARGKTKHAPKVKNVVIHPLSAGSIYAWGYKFDNLALHLQLSMCVWEEMQRISTPRNPPALKNKSKRAYTHTYE